MDSHADTCCLGNVCLVLYETDKAEVSGFTNTLGSIKETPIITGVVAYDDQATGETYLLYFHQSLHLPMMNKCLLNPNQMREAGLTVNDVPLKYLPADERKATSHSIVAPLSDSNEKLVIPFDLIGVMSSFTVRKPTWDEIRDIDPMNRIQMTNQSPEWSPNDSTEDVDESKLRVDLGNDSIRLKRTKNVTPKNGPNGACKHKNDSRYTASKEGDN